MTGTIEHAAQTDLDANKKVIRSFVEAWNTRDFDRLTTLMGDDATLHVGGGDVACDPVGTRAIADEWTTAFPDRRFQLLALIAEGDRVVAHMPYSETHRRAVLGVEPTDGRAPSTKSSSSGSPAARSPRLGRCTTRRGCGANSA